MNSGEYRVRRATLDDIDKLKALWGTMGYPGEDLSKRITEFQVAEGPDGSVAGTVGLQIAERQGQIHHEAYIDFSLAEKLRPLLWERIQAVSNNHGLLRLWTREQAPFWAHCGLAKAEPDLEQKIPMLWRGQGTGWLTLKLREDVEALVSADKEFAVFMEAEKQKTQRTIQQARVLKSIVTLLALAGFALLIGVAFLLVKKNPHILGR